MGRPRGHASSECGSACLQVAHFRAVGVWLDEFECGGLFVSQWQLEAVAEGDEVFTPQLLLLVCGHPALTCGAHAVALLGLRQDHGRAACGLHGLVVRGIDLHQIVTASLEQVDLLVAQALHQGGELWVLAEEVLAVVAAILGRKGLELAIDGLCEGLSQGAGGVVRKKSVPVRSPHQLDDAPASAHEQRFQLVDDAAVATHGPIQTLQIAVHHPDQVVELLARSQRQGRHAFGLVHLAVAEHAPDLAASCVLQMTVVEVAHEARLEDGADRAQPHRAGGELPEIRHQPGVRVAAEALLASGPR